MPDVKSLRVGQHVIFCDTTGNDHDALLSVCWGDYPDGCINVVIVNPEEKQQDQYGRQILRETSVPHVSSAGAHGFYYRLPDEEKKVYAAPTAQ